MASAIPYKEQPGAARATVNTAMPTRPQRGAAGPMQPELTPEQKVQQMLAMGQITPEQAAQMLANMQSGVTRGRMPVRRQRKPSSPSTFPPMGGIASA